MSIAQTFRDVLNVNSNDVVLPLASASTKEPIHNTSKLCLVWFLDCEVNPRNMTYTQRD